MKLWYVLPWQPLPRTLLSTTVFLERIHTTVKGNTGSLNWCPPSCIYLKSLSFSMKWRGNTCIISVQISLSKTSFQVFTFSREWLYDVHSRAGLFIYCGVSGLGLHTVSVGTFQYVGNMEGSMQITAQCLAVLCPCLQSLRSCIVPFPEVVGSILYRSVQVFLCGLSVSNIPFTWTKKCGCSFTFSRESVCDLFLPLLYIKSCWVIRLLCKL